ncbi:MAG: EAL domain-containing protein [Shinella sp.]|nr:EAL domain-containing protein [Shinella sp.]
MVVLAAFRRRLRTAAEWARPSLFPAAMAAAMIVTAGLYYEKQNERVHLNELQGAVANELNLIGARLQAEIGANVAALRSFADLYSISPENAQSQFHLFARRLLLQNSQFRRIGVAPDAVVTHTFPLKGNEGHLGIDFKKFGSFRTAANLDPRQREPMMLGPVQLPNGTRGFDLFMPIFTQEPGRSALWGYIDGIIDERQLYIDAGLIGAADEKSRPGWAGGKDILLSVRDVSVANNVQDPFFGDPAIFRNSPVLRVLDFPGGRWELAAIPRGGWNNPPENRNEVRLLIAGAAAVIIVPIFLTGGLVSERQRNIANLKQANHRIEHNALHDPLTELANRRKLDDELNKLAALSRQEEIRLGILHIDLDRFKQINDTLGHAAGDALLVHASRILRSCVREEDLVARIGGDEFVIVIGDTIGQSYLTALSQRIISLMQHPVDYHGHMCRFGVSIGIARTKGRRLDTRQLLVNADIALYRAKALGRNRYEFFTEALQAEIITNKRIADDILSGIENNEFVPFYQPQIDAGTLKLAGVEALIRWHHPRDGILAPDRFLKIAEDLNVVSTLDRIVLEKALIDCSRWAAKGVIVPKISVNVSAKRLRDETLVNSLTGLSINPGQISFELVESIFLDETDDIVLDNIAKIKALGIDIEIDDFGTGHTSIVSLLKLKPKRLKIDRQLVAPILASRHEQALVRSIIDIGRSLGIEIVAEGVETMQHAEMLSVLGCDLLQGFAFARPLSRDDFLTFATANQWKLAS